MQRNPPRVGDQRTEDDLRVDERDPDPRQRSRRSTGPPHRRSVGCRREHRDGDGEPEEGLGETAVDDRERFLQQHDAQTTEHPLDDDGRHRDDAQRAEVSAFAPERSGEREREQAHHGAEEPVAVLVEDPADHL